MPQNLYSVANRFLICSVAPTLLIATLSSPASGAVILGDDFDNVGDAEKNSITGTATFGAWDTVNGVVAPAASLTFTDPGNSDAALPFHETQDGELDVNENIGNGGAWETSFVLDLDASTSEIDLTTLDLTTGLLNGSGARNDAGNKDGVYTVNITGSLSGALGSASTTIDYTIADDIPVSIDLTGFASLTAAETYTVSLSVVRDDATFGHHVSLEDLTLNGDITAAVIPEPASFGLVAIGIGLMLGSRRRG